MASLPLFAAALLDPDQALPAGLHTWNGSDPAPRFAVYRNNVASSLVAALADTFPVVRELVGAEFFSAMARVFVARHPPGSPVLTFYGAEFADFVASFPPAASLPYLADMARLEQARVLAFHAADADALVADQIAAHLEAPHQLPGARLQLHPSLSVVCASQAVVSLWAAHQGQGRIEDVALHTPEAALVLRQHGDAAVLPVPLALAGFCQQLASGSTLGSAAEQAQQTAPATGTPFDPGQALALLLQHGAVIGWLPG